MAKTPFTQNLTPEQRAQLLKTREHSLGSSDDRLPAETNIAWEIQLREPLPASEAEPASSAPTPAGQSIAPASQQTPAPASASVAAPTVPGLTAHDSSSPALPAGGFIQALPN